MSLQSLKIPDAWQVEFNRFASQKNESPAENLLLLVHNISRYKSSIPESPQKYILHLSRAEDSRYVLLLIKGNWQEQKMVTVTSGGKNQYLIRRYQPDAEDAVLLSFEEKEQYFVVDVINTLLILICEQKWDVSLENLTMVLNRKMSQCKAVYQQETELCAYIQEQLADKKHLSEAFYQSCLELPAYRRLWALSAGNAELYFARLQWLRDKLTGG